MININKATLKGRLTKDPEIKHTANSSVCNFSIAVDRRFTKQGEEKQTDFIPIVVWGKTAEFCSKYFTKGQEILIAGRIQVRNWEDTEGKRHYVTEVVAEKVYFVGKKNDNSNQNIGGKTQRQNNTSNQKTNEPAFYPIESDDELPF